MKKVFALLAVLVLTGFSLNAQIEEGHVKYKIKVSSEEEENKMAVAMANSLTMEIFFKGPKTRVEFKMGPFMNISTITDASKDKMLMLTSGMMGKKAIVSTISEMEEKESETTTKDTDVEVVYTDETKKIQGYLCHKAIIKSEDGGTAIFWYTKEVQVSKNGQSYLNEDIPGFPMEFEMDQGGMKVTMVASSFEETVKNADKLFSMEIPEGYEETTMEEMVPQQK